MTRKNIIAGILTALSLLLFFGLAVTVVEPFPSNANVVTADGHYFPPIATPLIRRGFHNEPLVGLDIMTRAEAEARGLTRDPACAENGDFTGAQMTLLRYWLQRIGLARNINRWNDDGTWRW